MTIKEQLESRDKLKSKGSEHKHRRVEGARRKSLRYLKSEGSTARRRTQRQSRRSRAHLERGQGVGAARHARQREHVVAGRAGPAGEEDDASRSVRPWLGSGAVRVRGGGVGVGIGRARSGA